ncbi:MAG: glutamine-hydrolyzing carbamoyl-phosphate synthase small subunit [Candidatus Brockarchaeota archaeon]|nr:glutamine-hydrolyzing carbamoyl-phosphate synthase small subunit [Candidatus Brockarchaeota archaeon]
MVLDDGSLFTGFGFGSSGLATGEVVFNTGMVGYTESITDPSYKGQILVQTYPLIGNYGVCRSNFESDSPKIAGYVVRELCRQPSHWSSELSLEDWLAENSVPGIEGVDTRFLTRKIRTHGTMLGALKVFDYGEPFDLDPLKRLVGRIEDPNKRDLVREVATDRIAWFGGSGKTVLALVDCGVKRSIVNSLTRRGARVAAVPPSVKCDEMLSLGAKGVVISNGPGDPKMVPYVVETARHLIDLGIPVLGICLGVQVLALASGGDTYKLKFGHRGQNHPVLDLETGRAFITSQNHGFAIDPSSLSGTGFRVTMVNANDKTVEGIRHESKPLFGVQFHPEASPGPLDTQHVFDDFLKEVR